MLPVRQPVPLDAFAEYGPLLVAARRQAESEIDAAAENAGFRHRRAIRRLVNRSYEKYMDAPLGVQYMWFVGVIGLQVLALRAPLVLSVRALGLFVFCSFILWVIWVWWYMSRDIGRTGRFPSMAALDRQAWYVVKWTMHEPSRLSRPLNAAELKYLHAQFLDSARIDVAMVIGLFVSIVGALGLFRGKDLIQRTAEDLGRGMPLIVVVIFGFLGYAATVVIRQRLTERELLRGAIDHYATLDLQK